MHPVVNIEDPVGKVVGKRANPTPRAYLDQAFGLQKTLRGFPRPPERADLVSLCREFQSRGNIEFLCQYFAAKGIQPLAP